MDEKRQREAAEKALNDEQAVIWKKDKENYELEEKRLQDKINAINKDNQSFLQNQMNTKPSRGAARKMDKQEFLYNKGLLKEINEKKKESQYDGASRIGSTGAYQN